MTTGEQQIGRIKSIMKASEDTVKKYIKAGYNEIDILRAKEVAYDHIKNVILDLGYNPWQE